MRIIKKVSLLISVLVAITGISLVVAPHSYAALFDGAKGAACSGIALDNSATTTCDNGDAQVNSTLASFINMLSLVVGVFSVITLIYGGFKFMTSGGDASKAHTARSIVLYSLVGVAIASIAQLIVKIVITKTNQL